MKKNRLLNKWRSGEIFINVGEVVSKLAVIIFILQTFNISVYAARGIEPEKVKFRKGPYYFDGKISRDVLENYLDRSVTMGYFLVPGTPERYRFPYKSDDIRLIKNTGAKFIGRAIYRWSEESKLNDPGFLAFAKAMIDTVHSFDPEVIFQVLI
jgi:hypothetical protein